MKPRGSRSYGSGYTPGKDLEALDWTCTRAGRWIDPLTGRSYTAQEAWAVIGERGPKEEFREVTFEEDEYELKLVMTDRRVLIDESVAAGIAERRAKQ